MKSKIMRIHVSHKRDYPYTSARFMRSNDTERRYEINTRLRGKRLDNALADHAVQDNFIVTERRVAVWFEPKPGS